MKLFAALLILVASGCSFELNSDNSGQVTYGGPSISSVPSLNSPPSKASACTDRKSACGCASMTCCKKDANGTPCCKPEDCTCHEIQ